MVELGPLLIEQPPLAATQRVRVTCSAVGVELLLEQVVIKRELDLQSWPAEARARLLALAVSELIAASRSHPKYEQPSRPSSASAVAAAAAPVVRPALVLAPLASVRSFPAAAAPWLWGVGARLHQDRWRRVGWELDALAERGIRGVSLGSVELRSASAHAAVVLHAGRGMATVRVGAGFGGGLVQVAGEPSQTPAIGARSLNRSWAGGFGALVPRITLEAAAQVGYVLVPVRGQVAGQVEAAWEGPWVGLQLGIGVAL
jgi:hypothetical protein